MILNYIWVAFFLVAFVVAVGRLVIGDDTQVFTDIINASFDSAKTGFEISIGLTGILSLWLGIMKIGERAVSCRPSPGSPHLSSASCSPAFRKIIRPPVPSL